MDKFEVFFESGESVMVRASDESEAIEKAEAMRPRDEVAFAQLIDQELQAVA